MKHDISRDTYRPDRHYSSVRQQQGRVHLDADWNEQVEIAQGFLRALAADVIGPSGAPKVGGGFAITALTGPTDLLVSAGRFVVDGIQCRLEAPTTYSRQPDYPDPPPLPVAPGDAGAYLVYLDVWERLVTALDDPAIRESALGGPDTATRTHIVQQVKVIRVGPVTHPLDCEASPPGAHGTGALAARARPEAMPANPCDLPARAGYRRLENQLYRVEIHDGGALGVATFKWSRDNGAIVAPWRNPSKGNVLEVPTTVRDPRLGFVAGQWVEIVDDTRELQGLPGELVKILLVRGDEITVSAVVDPADFPRNPKVRRWDSASSSGTLRVDRPPGAGASSSSSSSSSSSGAGVDDGGWLPIEDGIEIRFEPGDYRAGEYWLIPARTLTSDVEWPVQGGVPEPVPAHGVRHCRAPLAMFLFDGAAIGQVYDCRRPFPALTDVCAEDVCFEGDACDMGRTTVQEALEQLCRNQDLRHHNKHLHGWGIVCGLQVHCAGVTAGPGGMGSSSSSSSSSSARDDGCRFPRECVTVRKGYAIDPGGNNLELAVDETLPLLDMIRQAGLLATLPDGRLADGDVALRLKRRSEQQDGALRFVVEAYTPAAPFSKVLEGTMLKDFVDDCAMPLVQLAKEILAPPATAPLVTPAHERLSTLINILWQVVDPGDAQHIFVSQAEHDILETLYGAVRALLHSKTFCAMFDGARPFPTYDVYNRALPADEQPYTIFAKGSRGRVRTDGRDERIFTVSAGHPAWFGGAPNRVEVFDVGARKMIAELEFPGPGNVVVNDVAVSPDGTKLYAVASLNGKDSLFAVADLGATPAFRQQTTLFCDTNLTSLAVHPRAPNRVFAVGRSAAANRGGIFAFDPENPPADPNVQGVFLAFNAVGHLAVTEDAAAGGIMLFASAHSDPNSTVYDRVSVFLYDGTLQTTTTTIGPFGNSGEDDLLVARLPNGRDRVYVLAGTGAAARELLVFDPSGAAQPGLTGLSGGPARLAFNDAAGYLLVTDGDKYQVVMIDVRGNAPIRLDATHPVEVGVTSIAAGPRRVYVLNALNNAIDVIRADQLPSAPPVAVTIDPAKLSAYRRGVLAAFVDLFAGLLQYLKDCLCDHFLVNCPEDDPQMKLWLGAIKIREGKVFHVCNFSQRRYVKSFPTYGYWLSLIPILPMLKEVVRQACCAILPMHFGAEKAPTPPPTTGPATDAGGGGFLTVGPGFKPSYAMNARLHLDRSDLRDRLRVKGGQIRTATVLVSKLVSGVFTSPPAPETSPALSGHSILGRNPGDVKRELADRKIEVVAEEPLDPRDARLIREITLAPTRVPASGRVVLYTDPQDQTVRGYRVVTEPTVPEVSKQVKRILGAVTKLRGDQERQLERRDLRISELDTALEERTAGEAAVKAELERVSREMSERVESLERELKKSTTRLRDMAAIEQRLERLERNR